MAAAGQAWGDVRPGVRRTCFASRHGADHPHVLVCLQQRQRYLVGRRARSPTTKARWQCHLFTAIGAHCPLPGPLHGKSAAAMLQPPVQNQNRGRKDNEAARAAPPYGQGVRLEPGANKAAPQMRRTRAVRRASARLSLLVTYFWCFQTQGRRGVWAGLCLPAQSPASHSRQQGKAFGGREAPRIQPPRSESLFDSHFPAPLPCCCRGP